jgi:hypothetical protein
LSADERLNFVSYNTNTSIIRGIQLQRYHGALPL